MMIRTDYAGKFSRERNGNEFIIHIEYHESFDKYEYHICMKDDLIEDALLSGGLFDHSRYAYEEAQKVFDEFHHMLIQGMKRRGVA